MAAQKDGSPQAVNLSYEFYRDGYRRVLVALIILLVLDILVILSAMYLYSNRPDPKFFATSPDGQIVELFPLNQPVMRQAQVINWANNAIARAYTYDYLNYRNQIAGATKSFSAKGWTPLMKSFNESGMLQTMIKKKLVMTGTPTNDSAILESGEVDGRYTWKIRVPIVLKMQGQNVSSSEVVNTVILVQRMSLANNQDGLAIIDFDLAEG